MARGQDGVPSLSASIPGALYSPIAHLMMTEDPVSGQVKQAALTMVATQHVEIDVNACEEALLLE